MSALQERNDKIKIHKEVNLPSLRKNLEPETLQTLELTKKQHSNYKFYLHIDTAKLLCTDTHKI